MADLHTLTQHSWDGPVAVRPWGWYAVLGEPDHDQIAAVKLLHVEPGQMLSLQTHELRRERWIPITDGLGAIICDEEYVLMIGQVYEVPVGAPHRLFDKSGKGGTVIEIMLGTYDEEDITRLSDMYHRQGER